MVGRYFGKSLPGSNVRAVIGLPGMIVKETGNEGKKIAHGREVRPWAFS